MSTSTQLAAANLRGQGRRLLSVLVAITMGIAFVAATLMVGDTFTASLTRDAAGSVGDSAVVLSVKDRTDRSAPALIPPALAAEAARALPAGSARAVSEGDAMQDLGGRQGYLALHSVPRLSDATTLTAGRLPAKAGEVAVSDGVARNRRVSVGGTIRLVTASRPVQARVVGVVRPGRDTTQAVGAPMAFAQDADVWAWTGRRGYQVVYLTTSQAPAQARDAVARLAGAQGLDVRTGADEKDHRVQLLVRGAGELTAMLMVFAVIAVFVSALVIANTFAILVAQRTRQLALLRCIGAERRQVRGSVLVEALLVALLGSALGVALGTGLAALVVLASHGGPLDLGSLVVSPRAVLVPLLVGLLVTLVASLAPARAATRVKPLAALRPDTAARVRRVAALRIGVGTLLALGGGALLVLGATRHSMVMGVLGGALSFAGMLMVAPVVVPGLARVVGAVPARLAGVPGRLALDNAGRNPARAAATASALLVGVTLITMMSVGAATTTRAGMDALDEQTPVDAIVAAQRSLTAQDLAAVRRSSVVAGAVPMASTEVTATRDGRPARLTPGSGPEDLTATDPGVHQVTHRPQFFEGLTDGVVLVGDKSGLATGDQVTLRHGTASVTLRADVRPDHATTPVVTTGTLRRLDRAARTTAWVRFTDGTDPDEASERLAQDVTALPGSRVDGIAPQRAEFQRIMDVVLLVVTGLLAIAVLIALVGIGNTLGLSVLERTQESGLLRALGLTKTQLRRMLGIEAITLALVGTVVGLALGTGYGIAGAHALLGADLEITPQVPWARLLVIAAVACGAGWLASVIPARRASRVSPSAALATD